MNKYTSIVFLSASLCGSELHAALFAGADSSEFFLRSANDQERFDSGGTFDLLPGGGFGPIPGTDITGTVTATLNPGVLGPVSIQSEWNGSFPLRTEERNVIDPNTFQTNVYTSEVTITRIDTTLNTGTGNLTSSGGQLIATVPTIRAFTVIEGSYEVVGPLTTVTNTFSITSTEVPATVNFAVSNVNFPQSFDLELFSAQLISRSSTVQIFDVTVDGENFTDEISRGDLRSEFPYSLSAVPEPSTGLLGGLVLLAFLRRKRS